mgnify:CR=1 FL=1
MRRTVLVVVVALCFSLVGGVGADAETVAGGDADDVADNRGDIVSHSGAYSPTEITLSVTVPDTASPSNDEHWTAGDTEIDWLLDTNGRPGVDYVVAYFTDSGDSLPSTHVYVSNSEIELNCTKTTGNASDGTFTAVFDAACIGTPPGFRYQAVFSYDQDADAGTAAIEDRAPENPHLAGPVVRGTNPTGGYNILTWPGGIFSFGTASYHKNLLDSGYPGPAIGLAETPNGGGYVILTTFGGIYTFGNAKYFGNLIDRKYPGDAVAVAMTPSGQGYAILTRQGALYTFGDAQYYGNLLDHGFPGQGVSLSYTPTGTGYAILTSNGGLYTFGDAPYMGNLLDRKYPGPGVSVAYTRSAKGYYILNAAGGLYTFGDAPYLHNLIDKGYPGPAVALSVTP